MIEAKNLSVKIDGRHVLNDISVQLRNGFITAILGPNGAGKSTLLKCLTGACQADQGTVFLEEKPLTDYSLQELSQRRAVLSQSNPVSFPFTALEVVKMGRNPHANSDLAKDGDTAALKSLECLDATPLRERLFPTLSGGEQQRIHLARVLAQLWEQENAYLFLDEPTSALDLKHQHQLLGLASKLAKEKNYVVCVIIHDIGLAMRYADHIILLKGGKVALDGDAPTILSSETIGDVFEVPVELIFGSSPQNKTSRKRS